MSLNFLSEKETAALLKLTPETLRVWRSQGKGPPWFKFEGSIRYDRTDLENYIKSKRQKVAG